MCHNNNSDNLLTSRRTDEVIKKHEEKKVKNKLRKRDVYRKEDFGKQKSFALPVKSTIFAFLQHLAKIL